MAYFREGSLDEKGWIHELAQGELHPEAEKILQLGKSFDPQQLIEESTIEFLNELHELFDQFTKVFNAYSDAGIRFVEGRVYAVAQTAADFMLFRNQMKLIFSNASHGVVQIQFAHHVRGILSVDGQENQKSQSIIKAQELLAQLGPFREVYWTFQGEKINADQVAKFYFIEFIRMTRHVKRSKAGDQLLLEQIKTLLEQKGFEL